MSQAILTPALFEFLRDLAANNNRDWFQANKKRYENDVKDPALHFISHVGPRLKEISPHIQAIPKAVGGSLFRIYRDVRFAKDKRPYKTHTGIQFRHDHGKDAHAPGFYLHLDPDEIFCGTGIWRPPGPALRAIRESLQGDPEAWKAARDSLAPIFDLGGDSLKTAPRGIDQNHPFIEDLRRKDFVAFTTLSQDDVVADDFDQRFVDLCQKGANFTNYICQALGVPF